MEIRYYTINDVAKMFQVSRVIVHAWIKKGLLKGIRPSGPKGHMRFTDKDIEDFSASGR